MLLNSTNVFVLNVSSMYLDRNFIGVFAMAIQHEYKLQVGNSTHVDYQPVRLVLIRSWIITAGWFGVRKILEIYDRLRPSEQAV